MHMWLEKFFKLHTQRVKGSLAKTRPASPVMTLVSLPQPQPYNLLKKSSDLVDFILISQYNDMAIVKQHCKVLLMKGCPNMPVKKSPWPPSVMWLQSLVNLASVHYIKNE